jgi:hypothetical protein
VLFRLWYRVCKYSTAYGSVRSVSIQARFGEDAYPIGRLILCRAQTLSLTRRDLARRLGYREISKAHKALGTALTTRTIPVHMRTHLAHALEVDDFLLDAVLAETARQQREERYARIVAQESAYAASFRPHLRTETEQTIPQPIFVAALVGTARLRRVALPDQAWRLNADERDALLKRTILGHYREHDARVPAFGAIVGYSFVAVPGYGVDYGFPYDLNGDPAGPMRPVERLGEAGLGTQAR